MPIQPAALELLAALAPVLERWGRWYLFGAQAVIVHGVPRLSADVDVALALTPDTPERFAADMQAAGFALAVDDADFVRRTRVMPFVHLATGMPRDASRRSSTPYRQPVHARRRRCRATSPHRPVETCCT